jgi:hypothetical protein
MNYAAILSCPASQPSGAPHPAPRPTPPGLAPPGRATRSRQLPFLRRTASAASQTFRICYCDATALVAISIYGHTIASFLNARSLAVGRSSPGSVGCNCEMQNRWGAVAMGWIAGSEIRAAESLPIMAANSSASGGLPTAAANNSDGC